jgi:outer membrane protein
MGGARQWSWALTALPDGPGPLVNAEMECLPLNKIVSGALLAALLSTVPAFAADLPSAKGAPLVPALDTGFDPFLVRLRGLAVLPNASGTTILPATPAGLALSNTAIPEVDLTCFFTKNWAVELIAGISTHRLTVPAGGIARTTLLPPTLTPQYHFALGQLDPYVGVGANYTWFLDTKSAGNRPPASPSRSARTTA